MVSFTCLDLSEREVRTLDTRGRRYQALRGYAKAGFSPSEAVRDFRVPLAF